LIGRLAAALGDTLSAAQANVPGAHFSDAASTGQRSLSSRAAVINPRREAGATADAPLRRAGGLEVVDLLQLLRSHNIIVPESCLRAHRLQLRDLLFKEHESVVFVFKSTVLEHRPSPNSWTMRSRGRLSDQRCKPTYDETVIDDKHYQSC
jgi:hypothetical protein